MILKSDLSKIKEGSDVFCTMFGWGKVRKINYDSDFPLIVQFKDDFEESYKIDGKMYDYSIYPSLFTYNPFDQIVFKPKWMMVSMDMISWVKRFVIYETSYFIALHNAENEEQLKNETSTASWKYAIEIQELEISMQEALEELAKLKGVDKSFIKIIQ